jgi:hypothetical protein
MLVELRVALHDRSRWELKQFHGRDLSYQILHGEGHWLYQCPSHKYKRISAQLKTFLKDEKTEVCNRFSLVRLRRVVRELAERTTTPQDHARFAAIDSVLTGGTDMHSQAAHVYLLICPQLLDELKRRPDCSAEYVVLCVLGMGWTGWDVNRLTVIERVRRIELCEALLIYNIGGEQLFYPFYDETNQKKGCSKSPLVGILSSHIGGIFSMQNFLALLSNGAVKRQSRQQFPHETIIERVAPNNEIETFFSQVAIHGYKPRLMELQAIMYKIDGAMRMLHDPTRRFFIKLSRKKKYDPVEFLMMSALLLWNDGAALDPTSPKFLAYLKQVEQRAIAASRGKMSNIRSHNVVQNQVVRDGLRSIAGSGGS